MSLEIRGAIVREGAIVLSQEGIRTVLGLPGHPHLARSGGEEVDCGGVGEEVLPVGERGGDGWPVLLHHLVSVHWNHAGSRDYLKADSFDVGTAIAGSQG